MQTLRLFAILLPVLMILPGRDPLAADRALVPAPAPAALSMPQGAPEPKRVTSDPPAPMAGEVAVEGIIDAVVKDQGRLQVSIFRVAAPGGAEERSKAPLPGTLLLGMTRSLVPPLGPDGERVPADALRPGTPFTAAIAWPVPPSPSVLAVRRLTVGVPEAPAGAAPASGENSLGAIAPDRISDAPVVVPMVFPVIGPVSWQDTFLASRGGGTRRHRGQDILAPKMTPVVAAFDGTVRPRARNGHYLLTLVGDHGWSAEYMHLNNDTPGTDDGQGGELHAFAPGIYPGARVVAGQLLGWVGDSGNAEGTVPHLHFELVHQATGVAVNAAPSLRLARRVAAPWVPELLPDLKPGPGEVRWNGFARAVDTRQGRLDVQISARAERNGPLTALTRPQRCTVCCGEGTTLAVLGAGEARLSLAEITPGAQLVVVGRKVAGEIAARAIYAEAAGLVPGKPLLAALAALAPAGPAVATVPAAPSRSEERKMPDAAALAPVQPAEGLLWVHGYVLAGLAEGRVKIRMDAVRLPGSREVIPLRRALVKEVIVGARTRLRDPRGKPIRPEALVANAEVEILGEEAGKTAPLHAATLILRVVPRK
jgi:murein DD-endopeptidase MepM/ murein hydrolase activator NlpD